VKVSFRRDNVERQVKATLKNYEGSELTTKKEVAFEFEGASFEDLTYRELTSLNLDGGVRIKELREGKWQDAKVPTGFIITHIDKVAVDNVEDLNRILEIKQGGILVEGIYQNQEKGVFGVSW
jgi:hypothetical protein